jgi:hypothetical protein
MGKGHDCPILEFWNFGILEVWNFGILAFWRFDILEFWNGRSRCPVKTATDPATLEGEVAENVVLLLKEQRFEVIRMKVRPSTFPEGRFDFIHHPLRLKVALNLDQLFRTGSVVTATGAPAIRFSGISVTTAGYHHKN